MAKDIPMTADENDWKVENDYRTLMEAEEIKKDSGRHAKAL